MHWREHPALKHLFHAEYPDDLPAIIHEGFRTATAAPEQVWIRVNSIEDSLMGGVLLNAPNQLASLQQGDSYQFQISGAGIPVLVREEYLQEMQQWRIALPCKKCGNDVLFDPPSVIMRAAFPNLPEGAEMEAFTTHCPLCGDAIVVEHSGMAQSPAAKRKQDRKWFQFWK